MRQRVPQSVGNRRITDSQEADNRQTVPVQLEIIAPLAADDVASVALIEAIFGLIGLLIGVTASRYGAEIGTDSNDHYGQYDRPVLEAQ